jgi:hypothetical protein
MDLRGYVSKLYDNYADAEKAVDRLHAIGYADKDISVVTNPDALPDKEDQMGSDGAIIGGVLGAIVAAAVVVGTGGTAALVAGPLVAVLAGSTAAGAVTGGIVGGLAELGFEADDVKNALDHGGVLVAVEPKSDAEQAQVRAAL